MSHPGDQHLDLRGLKCPQPVLRTRKRLKALAPGSILAVECTDPMAEIDLPNLVREMAAELLGIERRGPVSVFRIRRGD